MRISDIIARGKSYLLLGLLGAFMLTILFFCGYFIIYKKLLKGSKTLPVSKMIIFDFFVCYMAVVIGATFLDRSHYGGISLQLFSSYKMAWYSASSYDWRYIILNIALFVPMGVLLPLLTKKMQSLWKIVLAGLTATVIIETVQHTAKLGIFDIDDIFNNFLGVLIGGGVFLGAHHLIHRKKPKIRAILYFLPLAIVVICFASFQFCYNAKELGNMPYSYHYKHDMSQIELSCAVTLSDDKPVSKIYKAGIFNKTDAYKYAEQFFAMLGASMHSFRRPELYDETGFYYSDKQHSLTVYYKSKAYRFTDFSISDSVPDTSAQEADIRRLLLDFSIQIPADAEYTNEEDGTYSFSVNMFQNGDIFIDGNLRCSYYNDGTIKTIDNRLVECAYVRDCVLISQQNAFELLKQGKFNLEYNTLNSMRIDGVQLVYTLDTKGFCQPVYRFTVFINDEINVNISIPALDK